VSGLISDPEIREALKRIVRHEEEKEHKYKTDPIFKGLENIKPYWEMYEVPVAWKIVRKLLLAGIVEKFGKKYYILRNREEVKQLLKEYEEQKKLMEEKASAATELKELPPDLFDIIEGYDDIKKFIKMSLGAEEPVHVLLVGPPGTAKTLFLMELERLGGRFITAGTATKVGIRDIIYDELPRILIIDELDKISDSKDLSALLTWMESGRIIITKHGLRDEKRGKGWVFAACNKLRGLPPELLDRFQIFHIRPYTKEEFIRVVIGYLTKREGVSKDLAKYIAVRVMEYSVSVRRARDVARLAKTKKDVDEIVEIIKKYGG